MHLACLYFNYQSNSSTDLAWFGSLLKYLTQFSTVLAQLGVKIIGYADQLGFCACLIKLLACF